jgi:hypothetical protein
MVDESDPAIRAEAAALVAGYESAAGIALDTIAFDGTPGREEVRSSVRAAARDGERRAVVVLLGAATGWALEAVRDEEVTVAFRHGALPGESGRVLFTVRDDLAAGLSDALASTDQQVVTPSRIEP